MDISEDAVRDELDGLRQEVAGLADLFRRRLLEDKARASLYEALQDDVRHAREQLKQKDVEALVRESLLALDRLRAEEPTQELVDSVIAEFHEIFGRRGLRELPHYPQFDSSIHEVVKTVDADGSSMAGEVVATYRPGYRFDGRLLRPAQVAVAVELGDLPVSHAVRSSASGRPPMPNTPDALGGGDAFEKS